MSHDNSFGAFFGVISMSSSFLKPISRAIAVSFLLVGTLASQADAAPLYVNPVNLGSGEGGNCQFTSGCINPGTFAASRFTLGGPSTIGSFSFTAINFGNPAQVTGIDWQVYTDGGLGTPDSLLASGNNFSYALGAPQAGNSFTHSEYTIDIPDLAVGAGNFWLAFRAISPNFDTYLSIGLITQQSAQSNDFGATWASNYAGLPGIAMSVFGADDGDPVPTPGALALLGLGLLGLGVRRRAA